MSIYLLKIFIVNVLWIFLLIYKKTLYIVPSICYYINVERR
nr:MAG TPA: hypothetical protein [Caudoviricetes sp.]